MTNPVLDNIVSSEQSIIWQYDKAYNLIRLLKSWGDLAKVSCQDFWDYFGNRIFPIDLADTFGLNVWGNMLGIPRPVINIPVGSDGASDEPTEDYDEDGYKVLSVSDGWKMVTIKNTLYRGLLKGRFYLMCHTPTVPNYNKFLTIVFGASGEHESPDYNVFNYEGQVLPDKQSRSVALDNLDMTMGFTFPSDASIEESYLIFQHYDIVYPYPAGIRYAGEFIDDNLVMGLNKTQEEGQMYKAFVDGLVLAEDNSGHFPNGGILSTTDRANYKVPASIQGKAFICEVGANASNRIVFKTRNESHLTRQAVWIDWSNGDCGYRYLPASPSEDPVEKEIVSEPYKRAGLYAVLALYDAEKVSIDTGSLNIVDTYDLSVPKGETP